MKLVCLTAFLMVPPLTAAVISQTTVGASGSGQSGNADFGQQFYLDSSLAAFSGPTLFTLDSFEFYKGDNGGGSSTMFLNLYVYDGAGSVDFSPDSGNMTFVASSTNSVNYGSLSGSTGGSLGDAISYTFSDVTLNVDTRYFAVFSSTNTDGSFVGASVNNSGTGGVADEVYTNIVNAASEGSSPLYGGAPGTLDNDNTYTLSVTAVPEPGSLGLMTLAGVALYVLHRRKA